MKIKNRMILASMMLSLGVFSSFSYADQTANNTKDTPISSQQNEYYKSITSHGGRITKIDENISNNLKLIGGNANGFMTGTPVKGKSPIIIFFDPECPYCKILWNTATSEKNKNVNIYWVPLGFLNPERSKKEAELFIQYPNDYEKIMNVLQTNDNTKKDAMLKSMPTSDQTTNKIDINNLLYSKLGFTSFPLTLKITGDGYLYSHIGVISADEINKISQQ